MDTARQIRDCRVRAGKSAKQVAADLGLNDAWYRDLEQHNDELTTTLTLFQAMHLATLLNVRLRDLLTNEAQTEQNIPLLDLGALIAEHIAREEMSLEAFEEQVGWELKDFLQSPMKAAAEQPIKFLQALSEHLGIDWLSLIPPVSPERDTESV